MEYFTANPLKHFYTPTDVRLAYVKQFVYLDLYTVGFCLQSRPDCLLFCFVICFLPNRYILPIHNRVPPQFILYRPKPQRISTRSSWTTVYLVIRSKGTVWKGTYTLPFIAIQVYPICGTPVVRVTAVSRGYSSLFMPVLSLFSGHLMPPIWSASPWLHRCSLQWYRLY